MASELTQIKDEYPVLGNVTVNSGAEGFESFAKTLGSFAEKSENKAEDIASEQSNAMYINSVANAEQVKSNAHNRMLENPDSAPQIASQTATALEEIKNNAFVNKKDRGRLNAFISTTNDSVLEKATTTEVHQRQLQAAFTHYANWPDQLKAYQNALLNDHQQAETLKDAMTSSLRSLVDTGAITPVQAAHGLKTMRDVVGLAEDHYSMYGNPETSAQDYHTVASHPLNAGQDNTTAPINASTGWLIDYHNNDKTFQGVLADISQRKLPNPQAFDSLEPSQRQHALMSMQGVQIADGMINSGEPYPAIVSKYKELNTKGETLSYSDQATKNALGNYIDQLKNGNYLTVMSQTPTGNSIMQDFNQRNAAIQNSPIDNDQKSQMLLQNKNKMVDEAVAYGEGHHIPMIQPIPQADVSVVQNAFEPGQDPSAVLSTLGQYNKSNRAYVANALHNPDQRMVVSGVSLSANNLPPQAMLDFVAANQKGRKYLFNDSSYAGKEAVKDSTLMTRISTNLAPAMRIVGTNYDPEQAQILQNSMLKTTLNYAKYLAQKDKTSPDGADKPLTISTSEWNNYVDQASRVYATAYQQQSGTNWIVNSQQLPQPLTNGQLDVLADHVVNEGYNRLMEGKDRAVFESARSRNPLHMVVSPTNDLQAVDGNGKIYYTMPFTSNTLPYAQESRKAREGEQRQANLKSYESSVTSGLNLRNP